MLEGMSAPRESPSTSDLKGTKKPLCTMQAQLGVEQEMRKDTCFVMLGVLRHGRTWDR
jgi:hypothetical protein